MKLRSVNQVISSFRRYLSSIDPKLALFPAYGNLYVIFRALSSVITAQEYSFLTELNKYSINQAEGEVLDALGNQYGIERLMGSKASGGVLISGTSQFIRKGTILMNVSQDLEYEITNNIRLVNNIETMAPVLSLIKSSRANLREGTYLYSRAYPNINFIVGTYRDSYNRISGPIVGGLDKETDSDFRQRIKGHINGTINASSYINIYSRLKSLDFVGDLYIREHWPVPGIVTIYSNVRDTSLISQMNNVLLPLRPMGVSLIYKPVLKYSVNIELNVKVSSTGSIDVVDNYLDAQIHNYFSSLIIGQKLSRGDLHSTLASYVGVKSLTVLKPESDVLVTEDVLLVPGQIRKTFHEI